MKVFRFAALAVVLLTAAMARAQTGLPPILEGVGIEQKLNHTVPLDLKFKDETGADVSLKSYFTGKPVVLTLVYYQCPMLCTEVLNGLVKAMRVTDFNVGEQYNVVTVSFDPKETSRLAAGKRDVYLKSYKRPGAASGWHFLTGTEAPIAKLTDAVGFKYKYDPASGQFAHAAAIFVLTPDGRVSRYLYGVEFSARDLRLALVDASEGKIGTMVDQALLFCFHYDPSTGKYSAYVLNLVRLGGIVTVGSMLAFWIVMRRRDQQEKIHG